MQLDDAIYCDRCQPTVGDDRFGAVRWREFALTAKEIHLRAEMGVEAALAHGLCNDYASRVDVLEESVPPVALHE